MTEWLMTEWLMWIFATHHNTAKFRRNFALKMRSSSQGNCLPYYGSINQSTFTYINCEILMFWYTVRLKADFHSGKYASDRIGSDRNGLSLSCIICTAGPKSWKYFNFLSQDHRLKLEQKIATESPCAGSILFRSGAYFPEWKPALNYYRLYIKELLYHISLSIIWEHLIIKANPRNSGRWTPCLSGKIIALELIHWPC